MNKKIMAATLGIVMLAMLLCLSVSASDSASLTATAASGAPGDTVTVAVAIADNPGLITMKLSVEYDDDLELVGWKDESLLSGFVQPSPAVTSPYILLWKDSLATENNTASGTVVTLTFKIKETATDGAKAVTISCTESRTVTGAKNTFLPAETAVTVTSVSSHISGAQVSLGEDISVSYFAVLKSGDENAQMRFTMHDETVTVDSVGFATAIEDGKSVTLYEFIFTGVTPQAMGDNIGAELIIGDDILDAKAEYSVLQNCKNLLAKTADELGITNEKYALMETLIADLMRYGAAAQTYRGYKTNELLTNDEVIAGLTPTVFENLVDTDDMPVASEIDTKVSDNAAVVAAGLYFDYVNRIYIRFTSPDVSNLTVTVSCPFYETEEYTEGDFELLEDGSYRLLLPAMRASAMSMCDDEYVEYTIVLKDNALKTRDKTVQTLYYSLAAYTYTKQGENTAMANLAKAVYCYGLSAAAYGEEVSAR